MTAGDAGSGWRPILDGELAERAWTALRALADTLATRVEPGVDLALFWAYVAPALGNAYERHFDAALDRIAGAIEHVRGIRLFTGLAGAGWTIAHVGDDAGELLEQIDAQLLDVLEAPQWRRHFDLISGLAGLAIYFVERGDAPLAARGLARIADHLGRLAERTPDGITWRTPRELVPPHEQPHHPGGWYNVGVAHGVPGVIGALARMPETAEVAELRDGAIRWVLAQRTPDATRSRFPSLATPDHSGSARTAWCYGDAGVVSVLWHAHVRAGRSPASVEALARDVLARPLGATGVVDGTLCHGAAGLAHLANRFFHATGDRAFRDSARRWYRATLELDTAPAEPGLLDGAIGIGLALAAALTPLVPAWDRLLLADLPIDVTATFGGTR